MMPFRLFLSHCDQSPAHPIVRPLYDLLCESFQADIRSGALEILYDGKELVGPGVQLRPELVRKIASSDLVLVCVTSRWRQAAYFIEEVKAAIGHPVPIVPMLLLEPNYDVFSLHLGDLHPDFEDGTGRLAQVAVVLRLEGKADAASLRDAIRSQVGATMGGTLISQIRSAIIERARRDISVYDSQDQLIHDLAIQSSPYIRIFMYDGGTTIKRLVHHHEFLGLVREKEGALSIQFLYVDTDFKTFVKDSPEVRQHPELESIASHHYAALYESLVRCSGMIHNESPVGHAADVLKSINRLEALARKYSLQLEIRKTSQLPFFRMILTRQYVYYTHFLPTAGEGGAEDASPEYHSIRLAAKSPAGAAMGSHYRTLWDNAQPHL